MLATAFTGQALSSRSTLRGQQLLQQSSLRVAPVIPFSVEAAHKKVGL